jgi:hypothetical protein
MLDLSSFPQVCKTGALVLDPVKRYSRQTEKVKLQENNFVAHLIILCVKLANFITPFLLLSVKIAYMLGGTK